MGFLATRAPSAKFRQVGDRVGGVIVDARLVQTSDWKTKRPEYWQDKEKTFRPYDDDGKPNDPKSQLEVTVETGIPDESGETERRLFVKNKRQFEALRSALKVARARQGLVIGGSLFMQWTGTTPSESGEDAKTWALEYTPPAEGSAFGEVGEEVHLIGGGVWRRGAVTTPPLAPPPAPSGPPPASALADAAAPEVDDLAMRQREALERLQRAHESSPLAARVATRTRRDEEPPF